jgi:hypothetical protein
MSIEKGPVGFATAGFLKPVRPTWMSAPADLVCEKKPWLVRERAAASSAGLDREVL